MNGWYMHDPSQWPPADNIEPLLISMHFTNDKELLNNVLSKEGIEYLTKYGPVGTRDIETLNLLRKYDIPSYFSGCLTLTLPPPRVYRKTGLCNMCRCSRENSKLFKGKDKENCLLY